MLIDAKQGRSEPRRLVSAKGMRSEAVTLRVGLLERVIDYAMSPTDFI